jgi:hypothetical protein
LRELFSSKIPSVPRALKCHHAKRGASAKAEVRENANTQRTSKSKANMRERICFCSADFLKSFLGLGSAPQEGRGRNAGRKFFWFFGGGYGWKKNFKNGKIIL